MSLCSATAGRPHCRRRRRPETSTGRGRQACLSPPCRVAAVLFAAAASTPAAFAAAEAVVAAQPAGDCTADGAADHAANGTGHSTGSTTDTTGHGADGAAAGRSSGQSGSRSDAGAFSDITNTRATTVASAITTHDLILRWLLSVIGLGLGPKDRLTGCQSTPRCHRRLNCRASTPLCYWGRIHALRQHRTNRAFVIAG